jgi:putative addiction module killer protein
MHRMLNINATEEFKVWLANLTDLKGRAKILLRIDRAEMGNFGDAEPVGDGVFEMRIHFGAGYRVYYAREDRIVYLLLTGGDKSTQKFDIKRAKSMWKQFKREQS